VTFPIDADQSARLEIGANLQQLELSEPVDRQEVHEWKAAHSENGSSSKAAASITVSISSGIRAAFMVTVHREGRKAEVPLGGSRQAIDPRAVRRAGLDPAQLPGPKSRV
jgi:hypothetical protein